MAEYDEELERIKRKKLLEYQRRLEELRAEEQRRIEEAKRQEMLRRILTPQARARLANLRVVRPELIQAVENQLIQLAYNGRIPVPVTDELLKEILRRMSVSQRGLRLKYIRSSLG